MRQRSLRAAVVVLDVIASLSRSKILVFDLGGGTFDVSVLEMFDGVMEVRATTGDAFLGGDDFVDIIVNRFARTTGLDTADPGVRGRLRRQAELAKRALDREPFAEISIEGSGRATAPSSAPSS